MTDHLKRTPTFKARGRAYTPEVNLRRQTDSAAHSVELLEDQSDVLRYIADRLHSIEALHIQGNELLQRLVLLSSPPPVAHTTDRV